MKKINIQDSQNSSKMESKNTKQSEQLKSGIQITQDSQNSSKVEQKNRRNG